MMSTRLCGEAPMTTMDSGTAIMQKRSGIILQNALLVLLAVCLFFPQVGATAVLPDGDYLVQMADSDLAVVSSGYAARERVTVGKDTQSGIWHFKHLGSDYYKVTAPKRVLVLDSFESRKYNGVPIISFPWHGAKNQRWKVVPKGEFYSLINQETGLALDLKGNVQRPGTGFQGYAQNSSRGQLFRLTPMDEKNPPAKAKAPQKQKEEKSSTSPAKQNDEDFIKSFSNGPSDQ